MPIDDKTWAVRYLIVDTNNWWLGHQMLVAPQWIESVNWVESAVWVKLARQSAQDAPAFDPIRSLAHEDEALLYENYGHGGYWAAREKQPATEVSDVYGRRSVFCSTRFDSHQEEIMKLTPQTKTPQRQVLIIATTAAKSLTADGPLRATTPKSAMVGVATARATKHVRQNLTHLSAVHVQMQHEATQ